MESAVPMLLSGSASATLGVDMGRGAPEGATAMRAQVGRWGMVLVAMGCVRDPDPGGQEGEEVRGEQATFDDNDVEDGAGGGDDGGGELDTGDEGEDTDALTTWAGRLELELGLGAEAGARDCHLVWTMEGSPSPLTCTGCTAVFEVVHVPEPSASLGAEACADAFAPFVRTYGLVPLDADGVEVWVASGSAEFSQLATGTLADGALDWTAGAADAPTGSGDDVLYATDLEQGQAVLR